MLANNLISLIGRTPIVKLSRLSPKGVNIFVKLEYLNPTGSHKDRIALYMVRDAINKGLLSPGGKLVEASSGNTAISVAWISSLLGFKPILVVNENVSPNKINAIKALGGEVVLTPYVPAEHPQSKYSVARRISEELGIPYLNQMGNEANVKAHYETTGPEIFEDLKGEIDYFVMGVGTCGTLAGVGTYLKDRLGNKVKVIGVAPKGSRVVHKGGGEGADYIEGLVSEYIPEIFSRYVNVIDSIVEVSYNDAVETLARIVKYEGILGGPSTGANLCASIRVGEELSLQGVKANIVTIAADSIFKYPQLIDHIVKYS
ncbi:MAG: cysteine synthase family protein [Sulfolobales archaeon]|nr:cysteine synthase family protein [Sulfolobales archaeon]